MRKNIRLRDHETNISAQSASAAAGYLLNPKQAVTAIEETELKK